MEKPNFERVISLYQSKKENFDRFYKLLFAYNSRYNLTSITEEREAVYKHFYDSLAGEREFLNGDSVLEVGSGGGFPSIPLKIVRGDLRFTLVESTGKKCDFLRTVVRELSLEGVEVVNARAEELAKSEEYREQYDICCARAVARLNVLSEYCLPFVRKGGFFLAYKGEIREELSEAENAITLLGGGKREAVEYELPENFGKRALLKIKKERPTPKCYPRGNGRERKNPL